MPVFTDSDQLYAVLKELFRQVAIENPDATVTISRSRMYFRLLVHSPEAEVNLNGKVKPVEISYGATKVRPDIVLQMPTDMLHQILMAELPLKKAVATGKLKLQGNIMKAFGFESLFHSCQSIYPQVLHNFGIDGKVG